MILAMPTSPILAWPSCSAAQPLAHVQTHGASLHQAWELACLKEHAWRIAARNEAVNQCRQFSKGRMALLSGSCSSSSTDCKQVCQAHRSQQDVLGLEVAVDDFVGVQESQAARDVHSDGLAAIPPGDAVCWLSRQRLPQVSTLQANMNEVWQARASDQHAGPSVAWQAAAHRGSTMVTREWNPQQRPCRHVAVQSPAGDQVWPCQCVTGQPLSCSSDMLQLLSDCNTNNISTRIVPLALERGSQAGQSVGALAADLHVLCDQPELVVADASPIELHDVAIARDKLQHLDLVHKTLLVTSMHHCLNGHRLHLCPYALEHAPKAAVTELPELAIRARTDAA